MNRHIKMPPANTSSSNKKRGISGDLAAKYLRENGTEITQRPCSWCSRKTPFKCKKCAWHFCSRRCAFSDPLHNSYDTCSYENFCVLCVENEGYCECDVHTSPAEEPKETASSVDKRGCDNEAS